MLTGVDHGTFPSVCLSLLKQRCYPVLFFISRPLAFIQEAQQNLLAYEGHCIAHQSS